MLLDKINKFHSEPVRKVRSDRIHAVVRPAKGRIPAGKPDESGHYEHFSDSFSKGLGLSMSTIVLAVRTTWIGLLIVLFVLFALWFVIRAVIDLIHWFREEIIEDYRDRKRSRNDRPKSRP